MFSKNNFEKFPIGYCLNPLVGSLAFYMQQCVFIRTVLDERRSSVVQVTLADGTIVFHLMCLTFYLIVKHRVRIMRHTRLKYAHR